MQVSVEQTSELSRKMTVSIPEELIQPKVDARLKSLARDVKIDGFRPGKAPQSVIKKRYEARVRAEVTQDLIQSSYYDAIEKHELNPVTYPHIHPVEQAGGLAYTAEFEVYPVVSLEGLEAIEAVRTVAKIEDTDFDAMIEKLRNQQKDWQVAERAAQNHDRVTITFSGVSEGENFTGGKVEDYPVELGVKQMIPGFEEQLIGLAAGAHTTFELTFPENYGNQKLAGKGATFEIDILKVEEPVLPELNAEFVKKYGIEDGNLETFYTDVRNNMQRELDRALRAELKKSILDALYQNIQLPVPNALVKQEINSMMQPYLEEAKSQGLKAEDLHLSPDVFAEQAKRRIALGLILGEIIKQNNIQLDNERVRSTVEEFAQSYQSPEEVVNWYYADHKRLQDIQQVVLEEQTIEILAEKIKVSEQNNSFDEVMNRQQR